MLKLHKMGSLVPHVLAAGLATWLVLLPQPAWAQLNLDRIRQNTPTSTLVFAPYTIGSVIAGFSDRLYLLQVARDQVLDIKINSLGARAFVVVFNPQGRQVGSIDRTSPSQEISIKVPAAGRYSIFCYSGPTNHYYDLTVRVQ